LKDYTSKSAGYTPLTALQYRERRQNMLSGLNNDNRKADLREINWLYEMDKVAHG